jgi:hypothetical protein
MRIRLATVALILVAGLGAQNPVEPEFADVFFRLDAGNLVPLERQASAKIHVGPFAGSVKSEIPGGRSPVRFQATQQPIEFVYAIGLSYGAATAALFCFGID